MKRVIGKIKKGGEEFKKEVRRQTFQYMLAAFGLVAGLAWNDAIKSFIEATIPVRTNTIIAKFLYAFLITTLTVFLATYIMKLVAEKEEERK